MAALDDPQEKAPGPDVVRIVVEKNLIGEYAVELEKKFAAELAQPASSVVLDLSRIALIDSRGIALCVGLLKECQRKGASLSIEATPDLIRFFKLLKLNRIFPLTERSTV